MSDPLYRKELLRLAADAHGAGRLKEPHVTGHAHNPACGDKVTVDLALVHGRIAQVAHETKACILAQASASILGQALKGAARSDVEMLHSSLVSMLAARGPVPALPFDGYAAFDGTIEFPSRHRCVLLPVEAVLAAFDAAEMDDPDTPPAR
ncbi:MAG: iron-sulfur cluster assembly scaffold protein [Rhizomicrobium sp.]|jgi:NifU-like protein involved in Fe-S cluster formation